MSEEIIIISETGPQGPPGPPGSSTTGTTRIVSGNYTLVEDDDVILVDASEGDVAINWPSASTIFGKRITVKKIDSSAHTVTLQPDGVETIDGSPEAVIYVPNLSLTLVSDGTQLRII